MSKKHSRPAFVSHETRPIIVLGRPWSGKGTICRQLAGKDSRFSHFDMGATLRRLSAEDETLSKVYKNNETGLVPDQVIFEIIGRELNDCNSPYLLLDGVPRNLAQGQEILNFFRSQHWPTPMALHVSVTRELAFERLKKNPRTDRREHRLKGIALASYFDKRMRTFENYTWPLICALKDRWLIRRVATLNVKIQDSINDIVPRAQQAIFELC